MKKLLSLLSILTISGTAMPNVIAIKPYEKKEIKSLWKKIKNWYLGELPDNLPETILNRIYKLNKNIKKNSIRIISINHKSARVIWTDDDDKTTNFIDVMFTVEYFENDDFIAGNSRFYNLSPDDINRPEISIPILQHSTNERQKQCRISIGKKAGTSGIQNRNNKIERPKEAPQTPPTQIEEPIYATVLPKSQREQQNSCPIPTPNPRNLTSVLLNTNLGELPDNLPETILQAIIFNNTRINTDEINLSEITTNSARISAIENSTRYLGSVIVQFTLKNAENKISKKEENKPEPSSDSDDIVKKMISKFNNLNSNNNLNRIKVLDKNTKGGNLKEGDTYIATNDGVYLRYNDSGKIYKFNGLNFPIIDIELDGKGSAYVLNNTGKIYHLDLYGWGHQQIPKIITNINLNWEITGPITNDKKITRKNINLIKWSDYANSLQEFKEKYKHIRFNDFIAQAGGQGTTVINNKENTNIEFNTKTIDDTQIYKKENYSSIIKYDFLNYIPAPLINYVEQSARLYINNLFFEGEYLKATIISYAYSWMAVYHVWTKLKIGKVEFY